MIRKLLALFAVMALLAVLAGVVVTNYYDSRAEETSRKTESVSLNETIAPKEDTPEPPTDLPIEDPTDGFIDLLTIQDRSVITDIDWQILQGFSDERLYVAPVDSTGFITLRIAVCNELESLDTVIHLENAGYAQAVSVAVHFWPVEDSDEHQLVLQLFPAEEAEIYAVAENLVAVIVGPGCTTYTSIPPPGVDPDPSLPEQPVDPGVPPEHQARDWQPLADFEEVYIDLSTEGWVFVGIKLCDEQAARLMFELMHTEAPEHVDSYGIDPDHPDILRVKIEAVFAGDDVVIFLAEALVEGRTELCGGAFTT